MRLRSRIGGYHRFQEFEISNRDRVQVHGLACLTDPNPSDMVKRCSRLRFLEIAQHRTCRLETGGQLMAAESIKSMYAQLLF